MTAANHRPPEMTHLMAACQRNDIEQVRELFQYGVGCLSSSYSHMINGFLCMHITLLGGRRIAGSITGLAHPSVRLSVPYGFLLENKKVWKTEVGVSIPQGRTNRCTFSDMKVKGRGGLQRCSRQHVMSALCSRFHLGLPQPWPWRTVSDRYPW